MSCRIGLAFFCLLIFIIPSNAVCWWTNEVAPPPGVPLCSGFQDSPPERPWPRLPTDAEIETARDELLAYYADANIEYSDPVVAKYHYCSRGWWINNVDMEIETGGKDWTFLIYKPGADRFEFVLDPLYTSTYFLGYETTARAGFAQGTCSSGGVTVAPASGGSVSPESDDNSWIVIIGAIAIIGGGLAIGAKKLAGGKGEKAPGDKKKKKEPEKVRYILQLSTDRLTVTPDSAAPLKVTAWKIVGDSPPAPAPEAAITLTVPSGNEGLSVQPASGTGTVEAMVALVSQVAKSPVPINVTATAGKSSVSSQVTVEIPAEYLMEFF